MREILFRGKRIDRLGNGEWIEGGIVHQTDFYGDSVDRYFIIDGTDTEDEIGYVYRVDPDTVGQYTGLTDKNGKKIFEGDILFCTHEIGMGYREFRGKVVYKAPRFFVDCGNAILTLDYDNGKPDQAIIGNIHDNPELLEEQS